MCQCIYVCVPNTQLVLINGQMAFMLFCVPLKVDQALVMIQLEKNRFGNIILGASEFLHYFST